MDISIRKTILLRNCMRIFYKFAIAIHKICFLSTSFCFLFHSLFFLKIYSQDVNFLFLTLYSFAPSYGQTSSQFFQDIP